MKDCFRGNNYPFSPSPSVSLNSCQHKSRVTALLFCPNSYCTLGTCLHNSMLSAATHIISISIILYLPACLHGPMWDPHKIHVGPIKCSKTASGTWWRIGRVGFQPEGRGFDPCSNRHIGTLGKSFTCSCLCASAWVRLRAVVGSASEW